MPKIERVCEEIWAWKLEISSLCPRKSVFARKFGREERKIAFYAQKLKRLRQNLGVGAGNQQSTPKKE